MVPLRNRAGEVVAHAIIDIADTEWVGQWGWHLSGGYAKRSRRTVDGPGPRMIHLHRVLLGLGEGRWPQVDHVNRNRLDDRRINLRIAETASEQMQNVSPHAGTKSGYRGVSWSTQRQRWVAKILVNGKRITLGRFISVEDAAEAVRAARGRHYPFATD